MVHSCIQHPGHQNFALVLPCRGLSGQQPEQVPPTPPSVGVAAALAVLNGERMLTRDWLLGFSSGQSTPRACSSLELFGAILADCRFFFKLLTSYQSWSSLERWIPRRMVCAQQRSHACSAVGHLGGRGSVLGYSDQKGLLASEAASASVRKITASTR